MTDSDLIDRLAAHRTIGKAPRDELEWLASHGSIRQLKQGDLLSKKGARIEGLHIVLSGFVAISVDRGAGLQRTMEWRGGDITGTLPYSRLTTPPGDSVALEPTTILSVHADHFPELIQKCPEVTSMLVHNMVDRARAFKVDDLHDEKMVSLGKLSAGLAHELNNPASAIERSASLLGRRLEDAEQAARTLGASRLTDVQLAAVDALRESCTAWRVLSVLSPLQQAEREDAISDWLDDHGLDTDLAEALADTAVTIESLDRAAATIDGPALNAALRSAAAGCAVRTLASEIQEASIRIAGLVISIKGFTHMDQATVAEPVDLTRSLGDTVAVLKSKARNKSAAVDVQIEPDLPKVRGFVGELNQIWANLIDNALDAIPEAGRVEVQANRERQGVCVRIIDNGSGISDEIRERIFDPFFTTKSVGQGTGIGLDIVRRLVIHNEGDIAVESRPGRTEFKILLPIADGDGAGSTA